MEKNTNKCRHEGCECECCSCSCPYCTLICLTKQLIAIDVCSDVAAKIAADFVAIQCDQNCRIALPKKGK